MSPLRTGFRYGVVVVIVAVVANLYFLVLSPEGTPEWILALIGSFLAPLRLAAYLFLGILAALRARPARLEPGVPYRSLLLRDCALAAAVVAVMAGLTGLLVTALEATVLAGTMQSFAQEAAPGIVSFVNEQRQILSNPPPPANVGDVERIFQPPALGDLGGYMGNVVIGAIFLGAVGALIGALRGSFGSGRGRDVPSEEKQESPEG